MQVFIGSPMVHTKTSPTAELLCPAPHKTCSQIKPPLNAHLSICFLSPPKNLTNKTAWGKEPKQTNKQFSTWPSQSCSDATNTHRSRARSFFPTSTLPGLSLLRLAYITLHFSFSHSKGSGRFGNTKGPTIQLLKGTERA